MTSFTIGSSSLDTSTSVITGPQGSIRVSEKATAILTTLIEAEGEIVPYHELINAAWDKPVKESALYNQVATLRKALEENPRKPKFIKTVSKKGYLLDTPTNKTTPSTSRPAKNNRTFLAALSILSLLLSCYFFTGHQEGEGHHDDFGQITQHFRSPSTIILMADSDGLEKPREKEAKAILSHHLRAHPGAALATLPKSFNENKMKPLIEHFAASEITSGAAIYYLKLSDTNNELTLNVTAIAGSNKNLDTLAPFPPGETISDFEQALLERPWLKDRKSIAVQNPNDLSQPPDPLNPLDLKKLLDASLATLNGASDFNVEEELKLYESVVNDSLKRHPEEYISHYAAAEYACLIESYDACAHELGITLSLQPFDTTALKALTWNLLKFSLDEKLTVYFNYLINPYDDTFNLYRDSLLRDKLFTETISKIRAHKQLLSRESPQWWLANAQSGDSNNGRAFPYLRTNSNYQAAYNLLDEGRFNEAQQLLTDSNVLFFDKRTLGLQANIWQGRFNAQEWRSVRELAEDRRPHQNTLDKLRMIYFDIYSQDFEQARQGITDVFPELSADEFKVTRDNFRLTTYYSLALSKAGEQKRAKAIAVRQQRFLDTHKTGPHDPFWGLSGAEFLAINGNQELAKTSIGEIATAGHQLSNAFWFWPPIEENIFLRDLQHLSDRNY